MVALELVIDASGMQRGAQQATAALDAVAQKSTAAEQATRRTSAALSAAFQTTGGVNQIASGIAQSAKSFDDLGIAAGAFGASRTILELAKTAQDFNQLKTAVGATGSTFSVLSTIMKGHPLLTIATVISAAASVMSLFTSETKAATNSWDELAKNMAKAQLSEKAAVYLGISTAPAAQQQRTNLLGVAENAANGVGGTVGNISASTGLTQQQLLALLANNGNKQAAEYLNTGRIQDRSFWSVVNNIGNEGIPDIDPNSLQVPPGQLRDLLRQRYEKLSAKAEPQKWSDVKTSLMTKDDVAEQGRQASQFQQAQAAVEAAKAQEEAAAKIEESMRNAERYATSIGQNLGSVAYDVLTGVNTLRGALAQLVGSTARQGLSSIGGAIVGSLGAAIGKTAAQSSADQGINWNGGVGNQTYGPN